MELLRFMAHVVWGAVENLVLQVVDWAVHTRLTLGQWLLALLLGGLILLTLWRLLA